jgi:hypothetical protein
MTNQFVTLPSVDAFHGDRALFTKRAALVPGSEPVIQVALYDGLLAAYDQSLRALRLLAGSSHFEPPRECCGCPQAPAEAVVDLTEEGLGDEEEDEPLVASELDDVDIRLTHVLASASALRELSGDILSVDYSFTLSVEYQDGSKHEESINSY